MKRIQCIKCGQVYWTELQVDEALILSGEWIQNPCPKCRGEWAVVEPGAERRRAAGKGRAIPGPKRRASQRKAAQPAEEKAPVFSPARIRSLRKKLGISQKQLASLAGVSASAVVSWEKGKFKPKQNKMAQLEGLAEKGKEDLKRLLTETISPKAEKKAENVQAGKPKRKENTRKKGGPLPKKQKF